jgi:hypothetical protein
MLTPLLLMAFGFLAYFLALLILRVRAEIALRKMQAAMMVGAGAPGIRTHET